MATKYKIFTFLFLSALALDQGSKVWARQTLKPKYPDVVTVVSGYFDLRYSENSGSAFGMFRSLPGGRILLLAIGVLALVALTYYLYKAEPHRARFGAEMGLLAGGTLGNVLDRVMYGRVTDFVVWKLGTHEWPTFNVADAALVVGLAALFFDDSPAKLVAKQATQTEKGT